MSKKLGYRSSVRGIAMNPIDHPHGGRTNGGRPSVSPKGIITKGSKYKKYMTSKAFQIKMQKRLKFKNKKQKKYKNKKNFIKVNDKIFYHCKLWRRNFSNLLLNLSILLI